MKSTVDAITDADIDAVGDFLHRSIGERVSAAAWVRAMRVPWRVDAPNHGYLLRAGDDVVGVHLAFYSRREIRGQRLDICNLGAWCVLRGVPVLRAAAAQGVLAQERYQFTDLSPSGNVVPINERLGFSRLDTTTALSVNTSPLLSRAKVVSEPDVVVAHLLGEGPGVYLDHRATAAARHAFWSTGRADLLHDVSPRPAQGPVAVRQRPSRQ